MAEPKNLDVIMQLIMHGGDAKGNAIEAIEAAKAGDFALANEKNRRIGKSIGGSPPCADRSVDTRSIWRCSGTVIIDGPWTRSFDDVHRIQRLGERNRRNL
jgi:hypothetical protein